MGTMVTYPANGSTATGYLALPPGGTGPGVIVIQEWWGLVDHIKDVAERFAKAGFVALAPDHYHGKQTASPDTAAKMFMALKIAEAGAEIRGAAEYLLGHQAVTPKKVGVVGFCMGGQLALYAAAEHTDRISAAVDFYGIHPNVPVAPERVKAPVLGHFGREDTSIPLKGVHALATHVNQAGGSMEIHEYPAGHAFFNDTRETVYHKESADLAWDRTLAFFRRHLAA